MDTFIEILNTPLLAFEDQSVTLASIGSVLFIVGLTYIAIRIIERLILKQLAKRNTSPDLIHLIRRIFFIVVIAILVFTVLELLNVPLSAFAFISGAVAIGIGFGAQNILNNFISGWILMWERPIRLNDFLEIGDVKGTVEAINTRSTRIKRVDGVHLLIPNSHLLENTVVNWTLINHLNRSTVKVGVAYGSPVRKVEELLYQACAEHQNALKEPKPSVVFSSFGDNALEFELFFWAYAGGDKELRVVRSDLRFRIDELFRAADITIAYPQRDVHLNSLTPIEVTLVDKQ
jgi:small-conductance mechanosensitive channel